MTTRKKYISVKKFAKLANRTPQAIYKQVDNQLNRFVKLVDNRKMIDIQALEEIYGIEVEQPVVQLHSTKFNHENDMIEQLKQENVFLKSQVKEKDKQIEKLSTALQQSQQTVIQAQALHANTEQKLLEKPKKRWWKKLLETKTKD